MTIKVEFSTDGDQPEREAGALLAFLMTLYPNAGDAALLSLTGAPVQTVTERIGDVSVTTTTPIDLTPRDLDAMAAHQRAIDSASEAATNLHALPDEAFATPLSPEQAFGEVAPASVAEAPPLPPAAAFAAFATAPATAAHSPAAPATAPAPPTTAGPAVADVERDSEGLPWHADIHSSNRKKSANGRWMKRRGVNQLVENRIRGELLAANTARTVAEVTGAGLVPTPPAQVAPPPPPAPTPPVVAQPTAAAPAIPQPSASAAMPDSGANIGSIVPAPPTASPSDPHATLQAAAAASPATPEKITRFAGVMTRVRNAETAGKLTAAQRDEIRDQCGLTTLSDLMRAPDDTFAAFDALLQGYEA